MSLRDAEEFFNRGLCGLGGLREEGIYDEGHEEHEGKIRREEEKT